MADGRRQAAQAVQVAVQLRTQAGLRDVPRPAGAVKVWAKTNPRNVPPPRDLMYLPGELPAGARPIYCCEGASDADAVHAFGLHAIGRTNAEPSAASLARLDRAATYRIWPDHDADQAGVRQAITWADTGDRGRAASRDS